MVAVCEAQTCERYLERYVVPSKPLTLLPACSTSLLKQHWGCHEANKIGDNTSSVLTESVHGVSALVRNLKEPEVRI